MRRLAMNTLIPIAAFTFVSIVLCIPNHSGAFCVSGKCFQDLQLKKMPHGSSGGGYVAPPMPSGPSPEELRKQREEKDLREAADDANDKAVEFAHKGDWDTAIGYLKEALEYEPDDELIMNNLRKVEEYKRIAIAAEAKRVQEEVERKKQLAFKSKAFEEAQSNLYHTQQGKPGSVFDTPDTKKTVPLGNAPAVGQSEQMSDRVKNDPRMIKAQKKLEDIQARRQKLDDQRTQLARARNSAQDSEKMRQLTINLDKVEKAYQKKLLDEYKQKENVEKLKRIIDAEVEKSVESKQTGQGSAR